jgi:hypothetical protein
VRVDELPHIHTDRLTVAGSVTGEQGDKADSTWIELEDGVQVQFQPGGQYNTGDYWLIPARTVSGDIEWPGGNNPSPLPPHGIVHHYAPLALVYGDKQCDCRCKFTRPCAGRTAAGQATSGSLQASVKLYDYETNAEGVYIVPYKKTGYGCVVTVTDAKKKAPVAGATVNLTTDAGADLIPTSATTDAKGEVSLDSAGKLIIRLIPPPSSDGADFTVTAVATKTGYDTGKATMSIKTSPWK